MAQMSEHIASEAIKVEFFNNISTAGLFKADQYIRELDRIT